MVAVRSAPRRRCAGVARELEVDLKQVKGSGPEGRVLEADVHAHVAAQKTSAPLPAVTAQRFAIRPRRMAQELGVRDLSQVKPAGAAERITKDDIEAYLDSAKAIPPDASPPERASGWRSAAPNCSPGSVWRKASTAAPQFALTTSVDMTRALELRTAVLPSIEAETSRRFSGTAILVRIVADALKHYPRANATFVDGCLKLHPQINIGVAVGTEGRAGGACYPPGGAKEPQERSAWS